MYIWIVIVNVDFVLHDCCNQFWRTRCIRAAWFLMHLLWGSISKKNITLRLLSWRKQWDRAAVLCDLAPLWWAYLTVCVFEREREDSFTTHSRFHTRQTTQPPQSRNNTLALALLFHFLSLLSVNLHYSPERVRPSRQYFSSVSGLV